MISSARLKEIFFYSSLSKEEFQIIEEDLKKRNVSLCIFLAGLSFLSMVAMYLYSFVFYEWSSHRNIYVYFSFIFLVVYIMAYVNRLMGLHSHSLTMYPYLAAFFSFTAIDSIIHTPDSVAVEPIVGLFLVSALFYMTLLKFFFLVVGVTLINSSLALIYSIESVRMVNISNFVIYGILMFFLAYFMNRTLVQSVLNAHRASVAGYLDLMTGLNNRNNYNTIMPFLKEKADRNIACIYVDANDLHSLNNNEGHEAGDRMLIFIATMMKKMFGGELSFRVGGDEFVAFVVDYDGDITEKCKVFKNVILKEGYHVSVGSSVCNGLDSLDMEKLVKEAETKMYDDKRNFYQEKGRNRRASDQ